MPRKKQSLTVEGLWSIKRVGTPTISPDGRAACAAVTAYDMNKNDGRTDTLLAGELDGASILLSTERQFSVILLR